MHKQHLFACVCRRRCMAALCSGEERSLFLDCHLLLAKTDFSFICPPISVDVRLLSPNLEFVVGKPLSKKHFDCSKVLKSAQNYRSHHFES